MARHVPVNLSWEPADSKAVEEGKVTGYSLVGVVNDEPVLDVNLSVDAKSYAFLDAKVGDQVRFELYAVKSHGDHNHFSEPAVLEGEVAPESSLDEAAPEEVEEAAEGEPEKADENDAVEKSKRVMFGEPVDESEEEAHEVPETPQGFKAECLAFTARDEDIEGSEE